MRKMITAAFVAALLVSTTACNQGAPENAAAADQAQTGDPIDGTWKTDLASLKIDEKPSVYLLKDGTYSCETCVPPLTVKADGAFQPVADRPYYDNISVQVVNDSTVKSIRRKGEKVTNDTTIVVSPDGNTLTFTYTDSTTPTPVSGKGTETRVAAAPAGSHAVSGSWKTDKIESVSEEGLTTTYRVEGDTFNMSSAGQKYAAKIGGGDVAIEGDEGGTMVSVKRLAANSIEETFKRDGKVVGVSTITVNDDGTMSSTFDNKRNGSKSSYTSRKQ